MHINLVKRMSHNVWLSVMSFRSTGSQFIRARNCLDVNIIRAALPQCFVAAEEMLFPRVLLQGNVAGKQINVYSVCLITQYNTLC